MANPRGDGTRPSVSCGLSRRSAVVRVAMGSAIASVFARGQGFAQAQEDSPVVTEGKMGEGITYEQIDFGVVDVLPPAPAVIGFYHARLEPGVNIPVAADDPGLGPHVVESGTMTVRNFTETIVIQRADGGQEEIPAGAEAALEAGDRFVWEPYVGGEIANDGDEQLIYYTVNIFPAGAATPVAEEMAASPTP